MAKVLPKKTAPPAKKQAPKPPAKAPVKQLPAPKANDKNKALVSQRVPAGESSALSKDDISNLLAQDVGSGMETMTRDSFAIPRLTILQKSSHQVDKNDDLYVEGAEVGMIYDSVSGTLYDGDEGIDVLLISYRHTHLNWWPHDSKKGKGLIGDMGNDPRVLNGTTKTEKTLFGLPNGSEIVPTHEYFAFVVDTNDDNSISRVLIPMAKSQYRKAKTLNTMAQLMIPVNGTKKPAPLFYRLYHLSTVPESNDSGNWIGWKVDAGACLLPNDLGLDVLEAGEALYLEARSFKEQIAKGDVNVQSPDAQEAPADTGGGGGGRHSRDDSAPM